MSVEIINYGATIVGIYLPDSNGKKSNVILGYDSITAIVSLTNRQGDGGVADLGPLVWQTDCEMYSVSLITGARLELINSMHSTLSIFHLVERYSAGNLEY
ncbi:unnamed protein product, partial [Nesidiocoris tenuis]